MRKEHIKELVRYLQTQSAKNYSRTCKSNSIIEWLQELNPKRGNPTNTDSQHASDLIHGILTLTVSTRPI